MAQTRRMGKRNQRAEATKSAEVFYHNGNSLVPLEHGQRAEGSVDFVDCMIMREA
jgi:hypothetical protein